MLIGLLYTLFVLLSIILIFLILFQRSKGSLGIVGSVGSNAHMLFGGSGGQDVLKKATWILVACFMGGSLVLALLKNWSHYSSSKYLAALTQAPQETAAKTAPAAAVQPSETQQEATEPVAAQ